MFLKENKLAVGVLPLSVAKESVTFRYFRERRTLWQITI